jgi:hypothetical protein
MRCRGWPNRRGASGRIWRPKNTHSERAGGSLTNRSAFLKSRWRSRRQDIQSSAFVCRQRCTHSMQNTSSRRRVTRSLLDHSVINSVHRDDAVFLAPEAIFGNLVSGRHMRRIVHTSRSVTCTTWGSRLAVRPSPAFLNIFNIAVFSGNTSAISSLIPASRAIAMRWRISAAPIPCP